MEAHTFFLQLVAILLTARLFGEVAARLNTPPVIGELTAGVVLGPSLLGWIEPNQLIGMLAEIGIILLLFKVGLETDIRRLVSTGAKAMMVAVMGFVFPFVFGFAASYWLVGLEMLPALFIGGTLTATSIGITVRVLTDLGRHDSPEGQIVLGAAVLDDVFGVVLLATLYEFSQSGGVSYVNAGKVVLFISIFFLLATPAAKMLAVAMHWFNARTESPGLIPTVVVALVLLFAWASHLVGAPELLGGFAAGLALSRRFFLPLGIAIRSRPGAGFARRTDDHMEPIVHLFTPIFFVMVGLSVNLREVAWDSPFIWTFSLGLFVIAVAGKVLGALLVGETWLRRWIIGIAMTPRGEVGLIFAELGRASGIFDNEVYAAMVIVIVMTTVLPPFIMKAFYARYGDQLAFGPEGEGRRVGERRAADRRAGDRRVPGDDAAE